MQTKDFTTQHTLRFLSNKTNFSKQPLFLLTNNMGLTGDDFIALYRITRGQALSGTFRESLAISDTAASNAVSGDGVLGITVGAKRLYWGVLGGGAPLGCVDIFSASTI